MVAAEGLWGDIVAQIGGDHVDVSSILDDPNQDPHEYESTVGDAATIAGADLVIVNGADYDPFMGRLLAVDGKSGRTTLTISKVVGVSSGANPHLWYDPGYVRTAAIAIERALAGKQAANAAAFSAGLARFQSGEARVSAVIARIKAAHAGAAVGYTEPVPGYLVDAAGLRLGTPSSFSLALENGTDPGPGDSAKFEAALGDHKVAVLLLNTQVEDPETGRLERIAKASGVSVVTVTETLPPGENFQTWQADQAASLLKALDG